MTITTTVQPWATIQDVGAPCSEDVDPELLAQCLQAASEILYEFTGHRWPGECTDEIRPCGIRSLVPWGRHEFNSGAKIGWCGCARPRACGCRHLSEIELPGFPVVSIDEVKINGIVMDSDDYRLDDHRWLVWVGQEENRQGWPCCQRIDLADTEPETFSVAYTFGTLPDRGGIMACASLACQLALAFGPGDRSRCRLPQRVTTISRQGVTLAILDPLSLFEDGKTGLPEVDMWIGSKNTGQKKRRATAMRIGQGRPARRTGV